MHYKVFPLSARQARKQKNKNVCHSYQFAFLLSCFIDYLLSNLKHTHKQFVTSK